jgi:hypothetical protein
MNKSILKPIIGGVFLGTLVFFTGPLIFIVLLLKFIFTPFGMGRMMMHGGFARGHMGFNSQMRFAMADKIRSMSDEEFNSFKEKMNLQFGNCNKFNN